MLQEMPWGMTSSLTHLTHLDCPWQAVWGGEARGGEREKGGSGLLKCSGQNKAVSASHGTDQLSEQRFPYPVPSHCPHLCSPSPRP